MKFLIAIFLVVFCGAVNAQFNKFSTQRNWTKQKKDIYFGASFNQFMGDLGGISKLQNKLTFTSLNWSSSNLGVQGGFRLRFHPYWATSSKLQFGQLRGNDADMKDDYRKSRNLHFRSSYAEISQRLEFILFAGEKMGCPRKPLKNKDLRFYHFYPYVGLGLFMFNPQAQFNGNWINLHPLRTEGQGLSDGPKTYHRFTSSIPLGVGYRTQIGEMWTMRFELEYVFTFSNYLDDVGGVYYDQGKLATEIGETAAYLSNPSTQNTDWFSTGKARGNNRNDGFINISVLFSKNITYKNYATKRKRKMKKEYKNKIESN